MNVSVSGAVSPVDVFAALADRRMKLIVELGEIDSLVDGFHVSAARLLYPVQSNQSVQTVQVTVAGTLPVESVVSPNRGEVPVTAPKPRRKPRQKALSRTDFVDLVASVFTDELVPMPFPELYRRVKKKHHMASDAFRRRMERMSDWIEHLPEGYRVAGRQRRQVVSGADGDRGDADSKEADGVRSLAIRGALDHFTVLSNDCGCWLCCEWHEKLAESNRFEALVPGHVVLGQGACGCSGCAAARTARFAFLAAENRRNLWCEGSYHAATCPEFRAIAVPMMARLEWELRRPDRTSSWWAIWANRYTLGYWFRKVCGAISSGSIPYHLTVSGAA